MLLLSGATAALTLAVSSLVAAVFINAKHSALCRQRRVSERGRQFIRCAIAIYPTLVNDPGQKVTNQTLRLGRQVTCCAHDTLIVIRSDKRGLKSLGQNTRNTGKRNVGKSL